MEPSFYQSVPLKADQIRVVRLPPSNFSGIKPLPCRLDVLDPSECEYEALSYCWGKEKGGAYINLNEELFEVTSDLQYALSTLCLPNCSRTIWIDMMCIDQKNLDEKSVQVSMMRDTYSKSQCTIVWLGKANDGIEDAFRFVKKLAAATSDAERTELLSKKGPWIDSLNEIMKRPYWKRSWTVQEVVLARDVILHCGTSTINFFELATVLIHRETKKHLNVTYNIYSFLKASFQMRSADWREPALGLFELAYMFRFRKLSNRLDRVYAFRGLLKSEGALDGKAAVVDYSQEEEKLWMTLCKETMLRHQTILPLVLDEENVIGSPKWFMNFSADFSDPNKHVVGRMIFWSGGLDDPLYYPLQKNHFKAAGGLKAQVEEDAQLASVVSARGFICDEIVAVGDYANTFVSCFGRPNYVELFQKWETLIGSPQARFPDPDSLTNAEKLSLTVTGGVWTRQPLDWRHWEKRDYAQRPWNWHWLKDNKYDEDVSTGYKENRSGEWNDQEPEYERLRDDACEGRRIVRLKSGRFGLTSSSAIVGDKVAILLGCDVPMVLHTRDWSKWHRKMFDGDGKKDLYGKTWKIRGQAFIHDLMHYQGDLEHDIASGKVKLETFLFD